MERRKVTIVLARIVIWRPLISVRCSKGISHWISEIPAIERAVTSLFILEWRLFLFTRVMSRADMLAYLFGEYRDNEIAISSRSNSNNQKYEVCHHRSNSSSILSCKRSGFLNGSDCMFPEKSRKVSFRSEIYQHHHLLMHLYPWLCGSKNEQHWYSMHESWNPWDSVYSQHI